MSISGTITDYLYLLGISRVKGKTQWRVCESLSNCIRMDCELKLFNVWAVNCIRPRSSPARFNFQSTPLTKSLKQANETGFISMRLGDPVKRDKIYKDCSQPSVSIPSLNVGIESRECWMRVQKG